MGIPFSQILGMHLRGSPASLIRRSAQRLDDAGIPVPLDLLEAHALAGGDLNRTVEAFALAKTNGVPAEWFHIAALDLQGQHPVEAVRAATSDRELAFDRYSPAGSERIIGYVSGSPVEALCRVRYRPALMGHTPMLDHLQERLATRIAVLINTATGLPELEARQAEHEAELLRIGRDILSSVLTVNVRYRPGAAEAPDA